MMQGKRQGDTFSYLAQRNHHMVRVAPQGHSMASGVRGSTCTTSENCSVRANRTKWRL